MRLWRDEPDAAEREEIVSDIQELIDDCSRQGKVEAAAFDLTIWTLSLQMYVNSKIAFAC